jgi:peptidoglycan/xylan/chitin deacetylase (PgdA/CDA1 family)
MFGTEGAPGAPSPESGGYWPNGARLAVSLSLMFEGGGQPISGAGGVIPDPIEKGLPDLPTNAFFAYGHYEGIPRVLDLMDKHGIQLSSFMIGRAVATSPDVAKEIVRRGHEAAAHGRIWSNSYQLSKDEEKRFIADSVETIQKITGQTPIGWNAYWMRNSVHILETLQELGFVYHIDEPSHDEPFIVPVRGKDFVTIPYTFHMNDIVSFPFEGWNPAAYEQALKDEFDQLYEEGAKRRRMMVISLHDRISTGSSPTPKARTASGSPVRTRSLATRSPIGAPPPSLTVVRQTLPVCRDQRRDEGEFRQLERCTSCVNC